MTPIIKATLSNQRFSIHYPAKIGPKNWEEILNHWSSFLSDTMVQILENKTAVVQVYSPEGDFDFGDISATVWTRKHEGVTYFLASSSAWNRSEIVKLVDSMDFELATLWFQLLPEGYSESSTDPVAFYQSANAVARGNGGDPGIECIGSVADGKQIVWENPKLAHVDCVLPQLITICEAHRFQWEIHDDRNENV